MPGVGGLSIANNLLANNVQLNLNQNQASLSKLTQQLSTGLRVNGPQDDPSGFSIATNLETQVQSYDQASRNIQDAKNASTVASGALTSITSILQQLRTLAIQASSTLLSATDRGNIQDEVTQLVAEVDNIASNTNFNGLNLLNGSLAGYQAAVNASALASQNSVLKSTGQSLVGSITYSTSDTTINDGTFQLQVIQSGATVATEVFYISSGVNGLYGTLLTTISGGGAVSYAYNDITITINSVATVDIGSSAYIKILKYVSAGLPTIPSVTVQSQANAGGTVNFGIAGTGSYALRVGGLNVFAQNSAFNGLASEDAISQIDNAINSVLAIQSTIGATEIRLGLEADNDNLASVNLQASESSIRDLNIGSASTQYTQAQLLVNFGTSLLAQANVSAQSVLQLFR